MRTVLTVAGLMTFGIAGCVTAVPPAGTSLATVESPVGTILPLAAEVAFDHNCPADRIRIIRANAASLESATTVDLDVCGAVRRYKPIRAGEHYGLAATWLDVTSLYPASALPPLPPTGK